MIWRGRRIVEVEKDLILKCKKYDNLSLIKLFHMYEKYLYNLCYGYTQNEQDALDMVQEIFIKVFNNLSGFDEKMPFHPWIRKITVNTCLNFKRGKKSNVISLNREIIEDVNIEDTLASEENIEMDMLEGELREVIRKNIKNLPEQYRLMITLRYYEDLSYNEISLLLNKPLGTVKTELYRAKTLLKKFLENDLEV
jgi:RNA polymerase sigma-70 factor, ECF subfamily